MRTLAMMTMLGASAANAGPLIVQLTVSNGGCRYELSLNGVVLAKADTSDGANQPINGWLHGASNALEVSVTPRESACRLEVTVTEVDPAAKRSKELARGTVDEKGKALTLEFGSSIDALRELPAAAPATDEKALRAYAVKLAGMVRAGKSSAFVKEAAPKYAQLARAFGVEPGMLSSSEATALQDFKKVLPALGPAQVVIEPLLGGRLHRLRHAKHPNALFVLGPAGEERTFEVIVGVVDGALKVVR